MPESRLIPQPIKTDVTIRVVLPDEARAVLRDLHEDRPIIGVGAAVALVCLALLTLRRLRQR